MRNVSVMQERELLSGVEKFCVWSMRKARTEMVPTCLELKSSPRHAFFPFSFGGPSQLYWIKNVTVNKNATLLRGIKKLESRPTMVVEGYHFSFLIKRSGLSAVGARNEQRKIEKDDRKSARIFVPTLESVTCSRLLHPLSLSTLQYQRRKACILAQRR